MHKCINNMHKAGIHIHGSFMFGGETDSEEVIDATIDFAIELLSQQIGMESAEVDESCQMNVLPVTEGPEGILPKFGPRSKLHLLLYKGNQI